MKNFLLGILFLVISINVAAQINADNVLENGIWIKSSSRLRFNANQKVVNYAILGKNKSRTSELTDSMVFLVQGGTKYIYIKPYNPIHYQFNSEKIEFLDPINEEAAKALKLIISSIPQRPQAVSSEHLMSFNDSLMKSAELAILVNNKLQNSKKSEIIKVFKALSDITFDDKSKTEQALIDLETDTTKIKSHFSQLKNMIKQANSYLPKELSKTGFKDNSYFQLIVVKDHLKQLNMIWEEQFKRVTNLDKIFKLVKNVYKKATKFNDPERGLDWTVPFDTIKVGKKSIKYKLEISRKNYLLKNNEIVSSDAKKSSIVFYFRKHQIFVPEVSVGSAYTFFEYNKYGTTSDSLGQLFIASPIQTPIRNLNLSTMINFNVFIPDAKVHPFYQLGFGINSGIPSILTGLGVRTKIDKQKFAISGGLALSWLKELNELSVGDKISGTSDIDDDLKFQFAKPTFYVGIQYNF